jgi:DNA replication initiation complex subunit (GINS family)
MTLEDYNWLTENKHIFNNVKLTPEEKLIMFSIYNRVTNETMKVTSCARCVSNVKKRLFIEYDRFQSL